MLNLSLFRLALGICTGCGLSSLAIAKGKPKATAAPQPVCSDLYFGYSGAPDFSAAYKCYQKDPVANGLMLSLMTLNGDGTPPNASKASDILKAMVKADKNFKDASATALEEIIQTRLRDGDGAPHEKVDFCNAVAMTTFDMTTCQAVAHHSQEGAMKSSIAALKKAAGKKHEANVDVLVKALDAFKKDHADAVADNYRGGSIAGIQGGAALNDVEAEFMVLAEAVAQKQSMITPLPTEVEQKAADDDLTKAYALAAHDLDKSGLALLKKAQLKWTSYRDAWVKIAPLIYADSLSETQAKALLATYLTEERTAALAGDEPAEKPADKTADITPPSDCSFDPNAISLALDARDKSIKSYAFGKAPDGSKTETAVLTSGTKVTFNGGGCDHLGFSYVYSGFSAPPNFDKATLIYTAIKLLTATPILKDSQENQHKLLEALAKGKTTADKVDAKNTLALPCSDGPGPTCAIEVHGKNELAIIYDFGV